MQIRYFFVSILPLTIQLQVNAAPSWNEATQLFAQHNYSAAVSELEKLDEKTPGNASIHFMLGKCYQNLGQVQQARKQFEWVAKNAPNVQTRQLAKDSLEGLNDGSRSAGTSAISHASGSSGQSGSPPSYIVGGSPSATVAAASRMGYVPCSYGCLNFGSSGWHKQQVEGHPDTDWWVDYKYDGGTQSFNQQHVGHIIKQYPNQKAEDAGACPNCRGTGWVKR